MYDPNTAPNGFHKATTTRAITIQPLLLVIPSTQKEFNDKSEPLIPAQTPPKITVK